MDFPLRSGRTRRNQRKVQNRIVQIRLLPVAPPVRDSAIIGLHPLAVETANAQVEDGTFGGQPNGADLEIEEAIGDAVGE